jgi:resolvase-like protein
LNWRRSPVDLPESDVVVVCKLDRLARSSRDLHNILHDLSELGCGFTSLGESWCDTSTDIGIEFERGLILKRCEEGIERAKARVSRSAASGSWMRRWSVPLPSATPRARRWQNWLRCMASASRRSGGRYSDRTHLPLFISSMVACKNRMM